ncbi:MAG: hypothetical protein HZA49_00375 [Planctomycetes bacterium]|nr:hypothetical protein [Planctomycetota bacterium]
MKKIIVISAVAIILLGVIAVFTSYQYYPQFQGKQTSSQPGQLQPHEQSAAPKPIEPATATATALVGKEEPMNLEFQMTNAVILPQFKSAFITNILTNQEQMCQEGNFLHSQNYGRWTVVNITEKETIIRQYYDNGSVAREHTLKLMPKPEKPVTATPEASLVKVYKPGEKESGPFKIEGVDITSPKEMDKVLNETSPNEILDIIRVIPDSVIETVLNVMPQEYLKQKIEEYFGLAVTEETYRDRKPADVVNILRKAAYDFKPKGENMLSFSIQVNQSDNSPISPTNMFTADAKVIFACFENRGPLAKLDKAIIKWSNTYTMKIVYWNALPLTPDAPRNYIYLKPPGKWDQGKYLVTIYLKTHDADPVAYGEFEVK